MGALVRTPQQVLDGERDHEDDNHGSSPIRCDKGDLRVEVKSPFGGSRT